MVKVLVNGGLFEISKVEEIVEKLSLIHISEPTRP